MYMDMLILFGNRINGTPCIFTENHGTFGISTEIKDHANYHVSGAVEIKQVGSCYQSRRGRRKGDQNINALGHIILYA